MKRLIILVAVMSAIAVFSGCSWLTPEQKQQAKDAVNKQITPENVEKVKEILK